ncbi:uncharacterized protein MONBRDRAFT_22793 [Monosiga brevicollis MX1]|uniref:Actin-related protein 8 n=1 Tax=Monosiga brevicollis TaxID=81824 RepID=A9US37_MONBE|nr:uncharacterized protein MONBRDRAFT_22793 [Monosiga brevicollis MX1]EDQ92035.1 predicted protein [Monosiga brevicollis MX1]|eukprot:XP_001743321.1 hypothetical protein [Monosiga brevicollis MX1]
MRIQPVPRPPVDNYTPESVALTSVEEEALAAINQEISVVRDTRGQVLPGRRAMAAYATLQDDNRHCRATSIPFHNDREACEVFQAETDVVTGEAALRISLHDQPQYQLRWPFAPLGLDTDSPVYGGSAQAARMDVAAYLQSILLETLDLSPTQFSQHRVVLVIPDLMRRATVVEWMTILIDELGFGSVVMQHSSVCATYGASFNMACVVDLGHHSCSVACVNEGLSLVPSRIMLPLGSDTIERVLLRELHFSGLPFEPIIDLANPYHRDALRLLKERHATLDLDNSKRQTVTLALRSPNEATTTFSIVIDKAISRSALVLFFPALWHGLSDSVQVGRTDRMVHHSDHLYEDNKETFLAVYRQRAATAAASKRSKSSATPTNVAPATSTSTSTPAAPLTTTTPATPNSAGGASRAKKAKLKRSTSTLSVQPSTTASPLTVVSSNNNSRAQTPVAMGEDGPNYNGDTSAGAGEPDPDDAEDDAMLSDEMRGIHQAVIDSILTCEAHSLKQQLFKTIVVIGAGARLAHIGPYLQQQIVRNIPPFYSKLVEEVAVLERPKDIEPDMLAWKGGAILAALPVAKELWVTKTDWEREGVRTVRERFPFDW